MNTPKLLTKLQFLQWLSKQDNNSKFEFSSNQQCLIATFISALFPNRFVSCGGDYWHFGYGARHDYEPWLAEVNEIAATLREFTVLDIRIELEQKGFFNSLT